MKPGIEINRDENGIPRITTDGLVDLCYAQGYMHATDRGLQILLMRIVGQGRICELLNDTDSSLQIDTFFRRMNWREEPNSEFPQLDTNALHCTQAYCAGVNDAFENGYPWELKVMGYRAENWVVADCILLSRMVSYLTLIQSQQDVERLFVEFVQAADPRDVNLQSKLEDLFPGILGGLDIDLVRLITLNDRIVDPPDLWNSAIPRMMASNNWVIGGEKTKSGFPIVANDPHLETNRLPNVWYEIVLRSKNKYLMGGSIPGIPGVLAGRNSSVAWGVTYAFIDAIDSWMEKCQDGKFYRADDDSWHEFRQRREIVKRKKRSDVTLTIHENDHGILDGDPAIAGIYLATKWAAAKSGEISLSAILAMWDVETTRDAMDTLGKSEAGWSFVIADKNNDIGFQMSGLVPKRRPGISGFVPLPGWLAQNDWQGLVSVADMPRIYNPPNSFFATANQDLNAFGVARPINMPMGNYRARRITQLIESNDNHRISDTQAMHYDVRSIQAELFMEILTPLLGASENERILKQWDYCYSLDSTGAFLFEAFYKNLLSEVFGANGFGTQTIHFLDRQTSTFVDFYQNFDRVLLCKESPWFGDRSRQEIYRSALMPILDQKAKPWKTNQQITLKHILFDGKLPGFLGFDKGPVAVPGGRATIHQGQIYRDAGRDTSFAPSFRFVTELNSDQLHTNMAGGPSDRRFSRWFTSDLGNWLTRRYKVIAAFL